MDIFNSIVNWIGDKFQDLANVLINFLPDSPFSFVSAGSEYAEWFSWVNYFIPFETLIGIGETWLVCITVYYLVMIGLRWAKVIGD